MGPDDTGGRISAFHSFAVFWASVVTNDSGMLCSGRAN
jgi:hypothetical protein